jgi:D-tyrosyl-tRNA(Tyr) deacylase
VRAIIQRVSQSSVTVDAEIVGEIGRGYMILLGYEEMDTLEDINWLIKKVVNMRIFPDEEGKMNWSLLDVTGDVMLISQFTLHASTKKGNRPSFIKAAKPEMARQLYQQTIDLFRNEDGLGKVTTGRFGEHMLIELTNDGPVTISLDSKNKE